MDEFVSQNAVTAYHPCGTCKMGTDAMAVVDPETRVHGIEWLIVVDSSIMPFVTKGNLNSPTIIFGEKGADHVLGKGMLAALNTPTYRAENWENSQRPGKPMVDLVRAGDV